MYIICLIFGKLAYFSQSRTHYIIHIPPHDNMLQKQLVAYPLFFYEMVAGYFIRKPPIQAFKIIHPRWATVPIGQFIMIFLNMGYFSMIASYCRELYCSEVYVYNINVQFYSNHLFFFFSCLSRWKLSRPYVSKQLLCLNSLLLNVYLLNPFRPWTAEAQGTETESEAAQKFWFEDVLNRFTEEELETRKV